MKLQWTQFTGIRPKVDDRLLPDGNAQVADNVRTERGGIRAMEGTRQIMQLPKTNVQTIYRFGQALKSETQYWFHWSQDVDVVKGPIENDTNERTYWTGEGAPRFTMTSLGTSGTNLPSASRVLGIQPPNMAPLADAYGALPTDPETGEVIEGLGSERRVYVYTFVTDLGEESQPSPPVMVEIVVGQQVRLHGMLTSAGNGAILSTKRIYRAQRGTYLFVAEIPAGTTQYIDNVPSDALGEALPSLEWDPPSPSMRGLTGGPNGMMAAFDGYTVRFCEPFRPHAWPMAYQQTVGYPVVALGQYGQSFVALTSGLPYVMQGVHPANIAVSAAKFYQPCLSKRSVVSIGSDVIWASPDGLVSLGEGGERILTKELFTQDQWLAFKPETMVGAWHEGWYIGSYDPGGGRRSFMFSPATQEWIDLPGLAIQAMYRDTVSDALYLCINNRIHKFRDGAPMPFTWKSQEIITPLTDFVAARVTGTYPVTFKLYKNRQLRMTKVVQEDEPFKLPGSLARVWEVEVSGQGEVLGIALSTSETDI